ncbi:hypothetical protein [Terrimonas alba]
MKQKLEIAGFVAVCLIVITFAIQAGRHHDQCRECNLAVKTK